MHDVTHDSTLGAFAPKMHIGSIVKFEIWVFLLQKTVCSNVFNYPFQCSGASRATNW